MGWRHNGTVRVTPLIPTAGSAFWENYTCIQMEQNENKKIVWATRGILQNMQSVCRLDNSWPWLKSMLKFNYMCLCKAEFLSCSPLSLSVMSGWKLTRLKYWWYCFMVTAVVMTVVHTQDMNERSEKSGTEGLRNMTYKRKRGFDFLKCIIKQVVYRNTNLPCIFLQGRAVNFHLDQILTLKHVLMAETVSITALSGESYMWH